MNLKGRPSGAALFRCAAVADLFYVIHAGGAIAINFLELNSRSQAEVDAALAKIGDTLAEIYASADAKGMTTASAADALAASRLRQP